MQSSGGPSRDITAHVLELKLKALILDTVHNIDIVQMLVRDNIGSTGNWLWQKQLRCYLSKGTNAVCGVHVMCVYTFKIIVLVIFTTILPVIIITQDCSNHRYFDFTFNILNQ